MVFRNFSRFFEKVEKTAAKKLIASLYKKIRPVKVCPACIKSFYFVGETPPIPEKRDFSTSCCEYYSALFLSAEKARSLSYYSAA